jgi:uncharacterized membrane protein
MRTVLLLHVTAGALGLLSGYVALYAAKGASLHRTSGMLFVCVMLTMAVTGMLVSAVEGVAPAINVPSALLTSYLVITSLLTVHPPAASSHRLEVAAMLMAVATGLTCIVVGFEALAIGGAAAGMAFPLFLFGIVALTASAGDLRMMRGRGLRGAPRLVRHLWRMCCALFIASVAFYLGKGRVPEMFRIPALLAGAVLLPIGVMLYWVWRLRIRKALGAAVRVGAPQPAGAVHIRQID